MSPLDGARQHLRTLNIICGAILGGIVLFAVVTYVLLTTGTFSSSPAATGTVGLILNLAALSVLVLAHFLPRNLPGPGKDAADAEVLLWHRKTVIVATALREGAALMALVGVLLTGSWWPGIGIVGLAALSILFGWPREAQLEGDLQR